MAHASPIPDEEMIAGHRRLSMLPPTDEALFDGSIVSCDAQVAMTEQGPVFRVRWQFDADERARIAAGEPVYVSVFGGLPPHCVALLEQHQGDTP